MLGAITNGMNDECYTPEWLIRKVKKVMGRIDLDPCSNPKAQQVVKARDYKAINENGLDCEWRGCVWVNPPYSKQSGGPLPWVEKAISSDGVLCCMMLTNAGVSPKWWQLAAKNSSRVLFFDKRIQFNNVKGNGNRYAQTLFLFTQNNAIIERFDTIFEENGFIAEGTCPG